MGKKGSKRKTRWRTLSIGAPPGEEDEEEGLRNGFVKSQEKSSNSHSYNRHENGQQGNGGGYKPRRPPFNGNSSGTSGYASSGGSRSHKEDSVPSGSPAQPKIIFNEEEYTRITTPRQDVLFKKGYLSRKKPLASNASTSATPSTTESQSASHSTADGSETTEDQQLLDNGAGEYGPPVDPAAQMGYGTFYDHASGYYYEYPVMLVGPAPVPAQVGPGILAAMPCGPVPLRPIEWVNPAFVPKFSEQPYCMMDYQTGQSIDCVPLMDEQAGGTLSSVENTDGTWNENGNGSASCSGSVVEEVEEQQNVEDPNGIETTDKERPQNQIEEVMTNGLENNGCQYMESVMMPQHHPIHVSHHVMPPMPQPSYMYPGHYMFGPPLVNVNGVTIQSGPILRNTDMTACAKRKKKKKRRKPRKPATGNADEEEDEEEEEYSSEGDNGLSSSSRLSWPGSTNPNTGTTTGITTVTTTTTTQKPLNPECQEFRLRPIAELQTSPIDNPVTSTNQDEPSPDKYPTVLSSQPSDTPTSFNNESLPEKPCETNGFSSAEITSSSHKDQSTGDKNSDLDSNTSPLKETLEESLTDDLSKQKQQQPKEEEFSKKSISKNDQALSKSESVKDHAKNKKSNKHTKADRNSGKNKERLDISVKDDESKINSTTVPINTESQRLPQSYESIITKTSTNAVAPKKKYTAKSQKFVREATPGPDLNDEQQKITSSTTENADVSKDFATSDVVVQLDTDNNDTDDNKLAISDGNAECSNNEDSGFESQTIGSKQSDYPITKAVKEWLSRANSPDVFITTSSKIDDSESEMEDDEDDLNDEPSKNLQGNPMPALSVNSSATNEDESLSRTASCGKFARNHNNNNNNNNANNNNINNNAKVNREGTTENISKGVSTRRKKNAKRKSGGDRRNFSQQSRVKNLNERIKENSFSPQDSLEVGHVVEDVCEFTEKDSVAGMRVALNSRIDSKVDYNDQIKTVSVMKTYEKGEILVSIDGKVLPTSYKYCTNEIETGIEQKEDKEELENGNVSLENIEEPDVLECWEVESFEPMVTPKKILQSSGMSYDGEAAEDCLEAQPCIESEYVQKYYRFTRGSVTSLEEDGSSENDVTVESKWKSKSVPKNKNTEWIPVVVPSTNQMEQEVEEEEEDEQQQQQEGEGETIENENKTPIDEAFEVYESCYTAKTVPSYFAIDPKGLRSRPSLYKLDGDGPIPCKAACCNIQ